MKSIIKTKIIVIFAIILFTNTPVLSTAADMWAETPGLSNDTQSNSNVTGKATFNYKQPAVDMWAETPDISKDREDHDVNISGPARIVNNFNPEMYAETPGLYSGAAGQQDEFLEDMFIAEE